MKTFKQNRPALFKPALSLCVGFRDLLFPPRCMVCDELLDARSDDLNASYEKSSMDICEPCLEGFALLPQDHCPRCAQPFKTNISSVHLCGRCRLKPPAFDKTVACGVFEGSLRHAIHLFKYEKKRELGAHLAVHMKLTLDPSFFPPRADLILPVPLHSRRLRQRGFNQALILCRELFRDWRKEKVRHDILARVRWTDPQIMFSGQKRLDNVRGAFAVVKPDQVAAKHILLVDDVYTTGATANECARVLKRAKAKSVQVLTLARVA